MSRGLRRSLIGLLLLVGVVEVGSYSGNQPPRDSVAAARQELGIDLEARRVRVGDITLHVVLAGPSNGPPVVLLHGYPELWYAWRQQMAHLAKAGFRVAVPDQRGYNLSDKPRSIDAYRLELLAADIAGLIGALGWEKAFVAGHDWGGGVAWRLALQHPDRVRKLVVLDTPHPLAGRAIQSKEKTTSWYRIYFQIPWLPEWSGRVANWRLLTNAMRGSARPGTFPDERLDLYRSAWDHDGAMTTMVHWYRAAYRFPSEVPGDGRIAIPTLILAAPHDAYIPGDLTRASLSYLDNGRLLELEQGSHWVLQEDPEGTSEILRRYFSEGMDAERRSAD